MANAAEMRIGLGMSPRHPGVAPTVLSMLQSARRGLAEAADESAPGARYVTAHLAALRAAAAVVAARGEPRSRRRKPHSVWELLPQDAAGSRHPCPSASPLCSPSLLISSSGPARRDASSHLTRPASLHLFEPRFVWMSSRFRCLFEDTARV